MKAHWRRQKTDLETSCGWRDWTYMRSAAEQIEYPYAVPGTTCEVEMTFNLRCKKRRRHGILYVKGGGDGEGTRDGNRFAQAF